MAMTLVADGVEWTAFKSISVTASMKEALRSFSATLAEEGGFWLPPGTAVQIYAGDVLVLDGYSNSYSASFDAESHDITIQGRGKAQDAIDCSAVHPTGRFEHMTIVDIANALGAPLSVTFSTDQPVEVIAKFQINQGETVFDAVARLADQQGLTLMGMADGSIKLTKADSARMPGMIREGVFPLLSATGTLSDERKYSDYTQKTQLAGHEGRYGDKAGHENAVVQDPTVRRYRPIIMVGDTAKDSAQAQKRADWQARRISGMSVNVSATVLGYSIGGAMWEPNKLVYVESPFLKLAADLMIDSVVYTFDDGGSKTQLSLVAPESWGGQSSGGGGDSDPAWAGPKPRPKPQAPVSLPYGGGNAE